MGLPKGRTNNPAGRAKGTPNKVTTELRSRMSDFLSARWEDIEEDFRQLDPLSRITMYERMLKFVLPAMQSVSMEASIHTRIEGLSDQQLNSLIEKVINDEQP